MHNNKETIAVVQDCWRELDLLHKSAAELSKACAASKDLLANGAILKAERDGSWSCANARIATPPGLTWRQKAQEAREIAHRLTVAHGKRQLLDVADRYERLAE